MTKRLTLLFALLLQAGFMMEAKQTLTKKGVDIISVKTGTHNTPVRSQLVTVDITGHTLSVSVTDEVGIVSIVVRNSSGAVIEMDTMISSPETTLFHISDSGNYR